MGYADYGWLWVQTSDDVEPWVGVSIVSARTVVRKRVGAVDWYADGRQRVGFRGRLRRCMVGGFVVVVIHDLNNCLGTVSTGTQKATRDIQ